MRKAIKGSLLAALGAAVLLIGQSTALAQRDAGAKVRQEFGVRGVPGRAPAVGTQAPGYESYYRGPGYRSYYRAPYRSYYRAPYRAYYRSHYDGCGVPHRSYYRGHHHHCH